MLLVRAWIQRRAPAQSCADPSSHTTINRDIYYTLDWPLHDVGWLVDEGRGES